MRTSSKRFDQDCVELSIYCSVKHLEYKELPVKKIQKTAALDRSKI